MQLPHLSSEIQPKLRTLQTLAGALIVGVITFAVIAICVAGQNTRAPMSGGSGSAGGAMPGVNTVDILRYTAAAMLLGGIAATLVMAASHKQMAAQLHQNAAQHAAEHEVQNVLFNRFFSRSLLTITLLEGPALLGAVIVLLSGNANDLVFVAVPVLFMIVRFPTIGKWERFSQPRDNFGLTPFRR